MNYCYHFTARSFLFGKKKRCRIAQHTSADKYGQLVLYLQCHLSASKICLLKKIRTIKPICRRGLVIAYVSMDYSHVAFLFELILMMQLVLLMSDLDPAMNITLYKAIRADLDIYHE